MKRYIYVILGLVLATQFVACNKSNDKPIAQPEAKFVFGTATVDTTETSATITTDIPYYTVDGAKFDGHVSLLWGAHGENKESMTEITQYENVGGKILFTIEGLEPEHSYDAYLQLDADSHGIQYGKCIEFTTLEHIVIYSFDADTEIIAYGLYADVALSNITYLSDGVATDIAKIDIIWGATDGNNDQKMEINGSLIVDGCLNITLPSTTDTHLLENTAYRCYIEAKPVNEGDVLRSEEYIFTTTNAVVDVELSTPQLTLNEQELQIVVKQMSAIKDQRYIVADAKKEILYRAVGTSLWYNIEGEAYGDNGLYATLPITHLDEDTTYEVCAHLIIDNSYSYNSDSATITTPKSETPTPPVEPPVGGDTSAIAGTWHLVEWCGATPSFEVYMEITSNGGVLLYQKMQSRSWECYVSSADITEDGVIWGVYSDGIAWGASYSYTISEEHMTWTNIDDSGDVSVYERSTLPDGLSGFEQSTTRAISKRFL